MLGGIILDIYSQNVYEVIENNIKKYVLIVYNISKNHYVGLSIHSTNLNNFLYIESINKYIDIESLKEYSRANIKRFGICKRKIFKNCS